MTTNHRPIVSMLEAIAATAAVVPWGIAELDSMGAVFIWDARPDASTAIMEAIATEAGEVIDVHSIVTRHGREIIGMIVKPNENAPLDESAGLLRTRYAIAMGPKPKEGNRPF